MLFLLIQMILAGFFIIFFLNILDYTVNNAQIHIIWAIPLSLFITYSFTVLLMALVNKIARILLHDREGELTGKDVILWGIMSSTVDIVITLTGKLTLHSPFPDVLYRLFGLKNAKGRSIIGRIFDPSLVEIGDGTMLGTDVIVSGHHFRRGKLYRKRVKIGSHCTIGGKVIVGPGTIIEDFVVVGACSLVPPNWHLESGHVYSGVPVQKVKKLDLEGIKR